MTDSNPKKRLHLIIQGKVQGVFFRDSAKKEAQGLDLTGCVKNLADGSVEIIAEGDEDKLTQLLQWAHIAPSRAEVKDILIAWEIAKSEFNEFFVA